MSSEEALDRAESEAEAASDEIAANLLNGGISVGAESRHHGVAMSFDAPRPPVAAQRLWPSVALLALSRPPAAHTGGANAKSFGSLAMGRPRMNRRQNPNRRSSDRAFDMSAGLRSGRHLESEQTRHGNPRRFSQLGFRSSVLEAIRRAFPGKIGEANVEAARTAHSLVAAKAAT